MQPSLRSCPFAAFHPPAAAIFRAAAFKHFHVSLNHSRELSCLWPLCGLVSTRAGCVQGSCSSNTHYSLEQLLLKWP